MHEQGHRERIAEFATEARLALPAGFSLRGRDMPHMPGTFRPRGARSPGERERDNDARRGSARERGYTSAWDKASKAYLDAHPLCVYCELQGAPDTPSTCVDHLYPHGRDWKLFWLKALWVASCGPCHSGFKQSIERQGRAALDTLARRLGRPTLAEVHP